MIPERLRDRLALIPVVVAAVSLLVWWLGWKPGILSAASVEQWRAVEGGDIGNVVPAAHTILVWSISRLWRSPAIVTLFQVLAAVALLVGYVRAATRLGIPRWLSGAAVLAVGLLPGPGSALISLDPSVAYSLAALWLLVEVMRVAADPAHHLPSWRLGAALGAVWVLDHSGFAVVAVVVGVLSYGARRNPDLLRVPVVVATAIFVVVQGPLFWVFGVDRDRPSPGEAYAPEIAAVLVHHDDFSATERNALAAVAPLDVWEDAYRCADGEALTGDREFDVEVIRADPGRYRSIAARAALRHPLTVLGHRWCAAGVLLVPGHPEGERFQTYTYNVPPNDLALERETVWEQGFNFTKAILVRTDHPWNLWLFWRPGLLVIPALGGALALVLLRRHRALAPMSVFLAVLAVAAATVRSSSYLDVFPVYLLALCAIPLGWLMSGAGREGR